MTGVWRPGACLWSQRAETSHPCAPLWLLCSALAVPLISHISSRSDIRHILVTPLSDHSVSGPHLPTNEKLNQRIPQTRRKSTGDKANLMSLRHLNVNNDPQTFLLLQLNSDSEPIGCGF